MPVNTLRTSWNLDLEAFQNKELPVACMKGNCTDDRKRLVSSFADDDGVGDAADRRNHIHIRRYNRNLDDDLGAASKENQIVQDSIGLVQLAIWLAVRNLAQADTEQMVAGQILVILPA
jgi:hypothetical protein